MVGCTASTGRPTAPAVSLPPDPHTVAALLKIATAFNHDYDTGDYGPVYARWDARSQAIITRADYIQRHKDCPAGSQVLSRTESVSAGRPQGAWLARYELGGRQLTDYWFYVSHRWANAASSTGPGTRPDTFAPAAAPPMATAPNAMPLVSSTLPGR